MMENQALVLDLVEWLAPAAKPYAEVMAAWQTSCPRLQVWEDAIDHGLLERRHQIPHGTIIAVTAKGRAFLASNGRAPLSAPPPSRSRGVSDEH